MGGGGAGVVIRTMSCHAGARPLPANTENSPKVGSMLAQRLRRRSNIEPTLGEFSVFVG